jgi:PadR family transcriptional regulator, regulatory protein PadR
MSQRTEIPPGTLEMLILRTLDPDGVKHGFQIAEAIQETSEEVLRVEEGSLYPALQRMLIKGWLTGNWGHTPERRRARYYCLTPAGRRQLHVEVARYNRVNRAIGLVLAAETL